MVYAVASLDSVLFYDTQHAYPFALVANMHYAPLTDLSWSPNGMILMVSSADGYCTFVMFNEGELGTVYDGAPLGKAMAGLCTLPTPKIMPPDTSKLTVQEDSAEPLAKRPCSVEMCTPPAPGGANSNPRVTLEGHGSPSLSSTPSSGSSKKPTRVSLQRVFPPHEPSGRGFCSEAPKIEVICSDGDSAEVETPSVLPDQQTFGENLTATAQIKEPVNSLASAPTKTVPAKPPKRVTLVKLFSPTGDPSGKVE